MKPKFSRKFFPFSPGIPWGIRNNNYIVPKIDSRIWKRTVENKDFIVTCYGGLLESFFSLSYCESLARVHPEKEIRWMGDPDLEHIVNSQGIAKISEFDLGADVVSKYPVPIFMDKENHAYFNVLNNYIHTKSYKSDKSYENEHICLKQIYQNCLIEWDHDVPIIRNPDTSKYEDWKEKNGFYDTKKYIVLFAEPWKSMHDVDCLGWNDRQVRELAEMVRHLGISVVSCANKRIDPYYRAGQVIRAPLDIDIITNLLINSTGVLSRDIDPLIVSMMLSDSTFIMSRDVGGIHDLYNNADFIQASNMIFTEKDLSPKDVYSFLEEEL